MGWRGGGRGRVKTSAKCGFYLTFNLSPTENLGRLTWVGLHHLQEKPSPVLPVYLLLHKGDSLLIWPRLPGNVCLSLFFHCLGVFYVRRQNHWDSTCFPSLSAGLDIRSRIPIRLRDKTQRCQTRRQNTTMSDSETKHNDVRLGDKTQRCQTRRQNTTMSDSETKQNAIRLRDKTQRCQTQRQNTTLSDSETKYNAVRLRDKTKRCQTQRQNTTLSDSETKQNAVRLRNKTQRCQTQRRNTTMSDLETKQNAVRLGDKTQRCKTKGQNTTLSTGTGPNPEFPVCKTPADNCQVVNQSSTLPPGWLLWQWLD